MSPSQNLAEVGYGSLEFMLWGYLEIPNLLLFNWPWASTQHHQIEVSSAETEIASIHFTKVVRIKCIKSTVSINNYVQRNKRTVKKNFLAPDSLEYWNSAGDEAYENKSRTLLVTSTH